MFVNSNRVIASALMLAAIVGMADDVAADSKGGNAEVYLDIRPTTDVKRKGEPPDIIATVIGGPGSVPVEKFSLTQTDAKVPVTLRATSLRPYTEGGETLALVVLIEGHSVWMGNKSYEPVEADQYDGAHAVLGPAIEQLNTVGPAGSVAAVVTYDQGVNVRLPMGDLKNLTAAALGSEGDYKDKRQRDLVAGVQEAQAMLRKVTTSRKALIIIGDGSDTNPETSKTKLGELRKQFVQDRVELYGVQLLQEGLPNDAPSLSVLVPNLDRPNGRDTIDAAIKSIVTRMIDRYYVTFPGRDKKLGVAYDWDGNEHEMVLKIDQKEYEPILLAMVPVWKRAKPAEGFPWMWVILPLGGLMLIIIGSKIFGKKPEAPVAAPVPMAEAPKPAGPMKTVMFNAGGDADGFPVVGWLVALNGPQQYQTFRLLQGVTKIGNGGDAHVILQDGFMSSQHCQVIGSPQGFQLQDAGSTNGCFVNDKRVERQDLVDNDVITVGKTHVVFKSIN